MDDRVEDHLELVAKRTAVLSAIEDDPLELRAIEERTGSSRATVNRAVRSLEDAGLVRTSDGECRLTTVGRLALAHHRRYRREWADLVDAKQVLASLPDVEGFPMAPVVGAEVVEPPESMPHRPVERLRETVERADEYRGALPKLGDAAEFRALYEHVATERSSARLVVSPDLQSSLVDQFSRRLSIMAGTDHFELFAGDVPEYGLVITERDGTTTVSVVVFEDGGVAGVLQNDSARAVEWARERWEAVLADADRVTDDVGRPTDGGVVVAGRGDATTTAGLSPRLEAQGFCEVSRDYLVESTLPDPVTTWRSGLDLAAVHTGYAVERTREDGTPVADALLERLEAGENCVLVGPPGVGKSTTAKRVACGWYESGTGPVLYRERGRGRAFEAVAELVATLDAADGHALVVVEDAVRPEAAAIFDAIDRLSGRTDVSVLLDAREREWRDPPAEQVPGEDPSLAVELMPSLSPADYERFVERFQRTTGVDVDASVERLREEIRTDVPGDADPGPSETFLLVHRLSLHGDDPVDEATLRADVSQLYDRLASLGETAVDVGVLANALNAAGIAPTDAHLQVVADDEAAVEAAIEVLSDRVLFGGDSGAYRTVHEAWSVAFLSQVSETEGETGARERFVRTTADLLALADRPDERQRVESFPGGATLVDRVETDPAAWADETVERLFAVGRERPKLAPLFGDEDGPQIHLPAACRGVTPEDCTAWLGRTFGNAGNYDRAVSVFEAGDGDPETAGVEWLLAHSEVCQGAGDTEGAEASARRALDRATEAGDDAARARCWLRLARVHQRVDDYDAVVDCIARSLSTARHLGDRRVVAQCLHDLGNAAFFRGDYDDARAYYEESVEIKRSIGDRRGESKSLGNLGTIANFQGHWDEAETYHERSLAIARDIGDRRSEAVNLANLGGIADHRGDLEAAKEYHERSLAIKDEIDHPYGRGHSLDSLGSVAAQRGNYDRAMEYYREALDVRREIGDRRGESITLYHLGMAHLDREEYDLARQRYRESYEIADEIDDPEGRAGGLLGLGRVALATGDLDRAEERIERSIDVFQEMGVRDNEAKCRVQLGRVATERGEYDRGRDLLTSALETLDEEEVTRGALDAIEALVELEAAAGDREAAQQWRQTALDRIDDSEYDLSDRREDFESSIAEAE